MPAEPPIPAPPALAASPAHDAPPSAPDDALFYEARVAASLGVSRGRVRAVRRMHLAAGTDYTTRAGYVVFTPAGLDHLLARLGLLEKIASAAPALPPAVPPGPPVRADLTVVRVTPNPRCLICRAPAPAAAAATTVVRVRDNAHFLPGMVVPCIALPSGGWQHTGRLPRRRGKW